MDFNRHIRPILSENCFACHGPDDKQRKAKLRLDTRDGILGKADVAVPGKADESELIRRVTANDPAERMPPQKTGKLLTPQQIDLCMILGAGWGFHLGGITPYLDRTGYSQRVLGRRLLPDGVANVPAAG